MDSLHIIRKIRENRYSYIESNHWLQNHEPLDVVRAACPNVPAHMISLVTAEPHGPKHTKIIFRIDLPA